MPPPYARGAAGLKRSKPSRLARRFNVKRAAAREHVAREPILDTYDDEDPDFDEGALTALFGDPEEQTPRFFAGGSSFVHEPPPDEEEDTASDEEPIAPVIAVEPEGSTVMPEIEPPTDREPEPRAEPAPEADSEPEPRAEPEAEADSEPRAEPEADSEPEPRAEPEADADSEPRTERDSPMEMDVEPRSEPDTDPEPQPEPEPEPTPAPPTEPELPPALALDAVPPGMADTLLALPAVIADDVPAVISPAIAEAIASVKPPPPAPVVPSVSLREVVTAQLEIARYTLRRTAGGVVGAGLGAALGAVLWGSHAAAPPPKPEPVAEAPPKPSAVHAHAKPAPKAPAAAPRREGSPPLAPSDKAVAFAGAGSPLNEIDVRNLLESIDAAIKRPSRPDKRAVRAAGRTR
jgi:hypothetical protein